MRKDLNDLAARFRAAVDHEDIARRAEEDARTERLERARAAREALLAQLVDFGHASGVGARRDADAVVFVHGDRELRFEAMGEGDRIRVSWPDMKHVQARLYREEELRDLWVLAVTRGRQEDRVPLVDQGLTWLLVERLGMPGPDLEGASEPRARDKTPARDQAPPAQGAPPGGPKRRL